MGSLTIHFFLFSAQKMRRIRSRQARKLIKENTKKAVNTIRSCVEDANSKGYSGISFFS